jgi:hypothetical protein
MINNEKKIVDMEKDFSILKTILLLFASLTGKLFSET